MQRPGEPRPGLIAHHDLLRSFSELAEDLACQVRLLDEGGEQAGENEETGGQRRAGSQRVPPTPVGLARLTDAFLLAAGMEQVLEDHRHRDLWSLSKVGPRLAEVAPAGAGLVGAAAAGAASGVSAAAGALPRSRAAAATDQALARLVTVLAARLAVALLDATGSELRHNGLGPPGTAQRAQSRLAAAQGRGLLAELADPVLSAAPFDGYGDRVLQPPNCFRSFDQRPADCLSLAESFAARWPDRSRPVLVVGIRTSGSYLAPLCAAFLECLGYRASWVTLRPGQRVDAAMASRLRSQARQGAMVALVDDPPRSGKAMEESAASLGRWGFDTSSVVLLVPLLGEIGEMPGRLSRMKVVPLEWSDWQVRRLLDPGPLTALVSPLLEGAALDDRGSRVASVESVQLSCAPDAGRGHVEATAVARVRLSGDGPARPVSLALQGVGLGWLGRDVLVAAERLAGCVVPVLGVSNGFLVRVAGTDPGGDAYREWVRGEPSRAAAAVARYVEARATRLRTASDPSMRMAGRGAVWETASAALGDAFGRAAPFVRPLVRPAARSVLHVSSPAVVDGDLGPDRWSLGDGRLLKDHFAELPSGNLDIYCSDPGFDLAGASVAVAAAEAADGRPATEGVPAAFESSLLETYTRGGRPVSPERRLLYTLVHAERQASFASYRIRHGGAPGLELPPVEEARRDMLTLLGMERVVSAAARRYLAAVLPQPHLAPGEGGLCAVDVDGVLETRWLGAPCPSPASAAALRTLAAHGFMAVLASGRPAGEVRERCDDYGTRLAVAEYGAVVLDRSCGRQDVVLTPGERADLEAAADAVASLPGVVLDPGSVACVRVRRADCHGRLRGLDRATVVEALAASGSGGGALASNLRVVETPTQTDIVPVALDKGRGLRALGAVIGARQDGSPLVALAVGDSADDVSMFALAERAVAPSDASPAVDGSAPRSDRPCQEALRMAVQDLVGHPGRNCPLCELPDPQNHDTALVLAAMSALGGRRREKAAAVLALASRLGLSWRRAGPAGGLRRNSS